MCVLLALVGCRVPAPQAAKYFDRQDPLSALKGFAYAVEARQWDYAYESLTAGTRDEIGHLRFRAAIAFLNDPIGDVSIHALITNVFAWAPLAQGRDHALVRIISKGRQADGRLLVRALDIEMVYEEKEWRLDLLATAESFAKQMAASWPLPVAAALVVRAPDGSLDP